MSGGLTPCRQLRPSSRRHISASNSHVNNKKSTHESQTLKKLKSLYSAAAFKNSKITSCLTVLQRSCKEGTW